MAHAHDAHAHDANAPEATPAGGHTTGFLHTDRNDGWWIDSGMTVVGLGFFGIYCFLAAWQASYYHVGPYTSPLYEPLLFTDTSAAMSAPVELSWFGEWPSFWPSFLPASPTFLIIMLPTIFRGTCYYYRKAYYRAFFGMPPACAVGPVPIRYRGETTFLVIQNLHRYGMYIGLALLPFLAAGFLHSLWHDGTPGVGLGSLVILGMVVTLVGYTLGCHSFRHLIGGVLNVYSGSPLAGARLRAWKGVTWLNERHSTFAWISLYWFLCTDVYIRLLAMGVIPDVNTWHGIAWAKDF